MCRARYIYISEWFNRRRTVLTVLIQLNLNISLLRGALTGRRAPQTPSVLNGWKILKAN